MKSDPELASCTVGLGCSRGKTWVQRLLSADPGINITIPTLLPTGDAPAVIRADYMCPSYRIKSVGSLLASVFIGKLALLT